MLMEMWLLAPLSTGERNRAEFANIVIIVIVNIVVNVDSITPGNYIPNRNNINADNNRTDAKDNR